jgi:putative polyketide hydroxylase
VGISTLDLFGGGFVLLTGTGYQPITLGADAIVVLQNGKDFRSDRFEEVYGISPDGAVLVRPDGYVAARWHQLPNNAHEEFQQGFAALLRLGFSLR